ncbi:uncharacterized protein LOC123383638 [Felis catus]|uniref:uncharacterized protein LOC123381660 n=1 Tax=Felis catus TaxID=9685 RepID=UPI001D19E386|nr:uncharacterized protein LOC123381660 [Felis catus]XP_044899621.1 uncharacterized protein LOC123381774 [Felis catus]XP_044907520.1 uncharacterized protein LOC123383638 [Felis catus]
MKGSDAWWVGQAHTRSRLVGMDMVCWGGPLVPDVHPEPCRWNHCVPGSRLCTLRSVSNLGATGGEGGRTLRMATHGCDVSGTAAGHCLYRNQLKIGKRLAESRYTCPTELCVCPVAQEGHPGPRERVAAGRSWEAEPGDDLGRPPSLPWPLHRVLVHRSWDEDLEPPEPEPEESGAGAEAGVAPEPDPRASGSSASLQAGVESGATPAGAGEPAGDLGPVLGQRAPEQSQLVPASAPDTVPATTLFPVWIRATNQGLKGLPGVFIVLLIVAPVPVPDPSTRMTLPLLPYPFSPLLFRWYIICSWFV